MLWLPFLAAATAPERYFLGKLLLDNPSDFIHSAFCGVLGLPNFGAGFVFQEPIQRNEQSRRHLQRSRSSLKETRMKTRRLRKRRRRRAKHLSQTPPAPVYKWLHHEASIFNDHFQCENDHILGRTNSYRTDPRSCPAQLDFNHLVS